MPDDQEIQAIRCLVAAVRDTALSNLETVTNMMVRKLDGARDAQNEAVRLMVAAEGARDAALAKLDELNRDLERLNRFVPLCWAINDSLRIDGDTTTFEGSQNTVEDFRAMLRKVDPNSDRGIVDEEE